MASYGSLQVSLAILMVGLAILSGPLVPGIDMTQEPTRTPSSFCSASGNASVHVTDTPEDSFELKQRRFGAGVYYLSGDLTTAEVDEVRGCPVVVYRFTIPELNFLGNRLYFVTDTSNRSISMKVVEGRFAPETISRDSYRGRIQVLLRGDQERLVFAKNVTVDVK